MEKHEPHYLRKIIEEENLTKYASKAGVTSFQNCVVKTYMKGVNESQLAKKYDVTPNAIHEAIYGYVVACRRYLGERTNSRKIPWIDRVEPEDDFLEDIENKLEVIFIAAYLITEYNLVSKDHYYLRWHMLRSCLWCS